MLELERKPPAIVTEEDSNRAGLTLTLRDWVVTSIKENLDESNDLKLRLRLKGNYLHILCESSAPTNGAQIVESLIEAFKVHRQYPIAPEYHSQPIYQVILYGKVARQKKNHWIKAISLNSHDSHQSGMPGVKETVPVEDGGYLVTTKNVAKTGAPDAIARYLSDGFTHLGISVGVNIEIIPSHRTEPLKRMWVSCEGDYSPDFALLADPIATKLRNLELEGFLEAVIQYRVQGERDFDWSIKADLTPPHVMLKEWANWGDTGAISELLNQQLHPHHLTSQLILKNKTLHIFCSYRDHHGEEAPPQVSTVGIIMALLQELAPQGIRTATIYGTLPFCDRTLEHLQNDKPHWVDWQPLAASLMPALSDSARDLAVKGNLDALNYLLQRVLNPHLGQRLTTGGIRVKLKLHNELLHILTEGAVCPQKEAVFPPIVQFFKGFKLKEIKGLRIYARYAGHTHAHWRDKIDFEPRVSGSLVHLDEPTAIKFEGDSLEAMLQAELDEDPSFQLGEIFNLVSDTIQGVLCQSKLFYPSEELDSHHRQEPLVAQSPRPRLFQQRWHWGLACLGLGLMTTLQLDVLFGKAFTPVTSSTNGDPFASEAIAIEPVTVPEFSLQKSDQWQGNQGDSFTQSSKQTIISDLANSPPQQQDDVRKKQQILQEVEQTYPSFNNPLLNEKIALYHHYLREQGKPPDVVIIGSSRALRGIDPATLRQALISKGHGELDIFNFGINGATVQVVNFVVQQVLRPQQLPKMIIFADGARAFNSGRVDITYNYMEKSAGYGELLAGTFPPAILQETTGTNSPSPVHWFKFLNQTKNTDQWLNDRIAYLSQSYGDRSQLKELTSQTLRQWLPLKSNAMETKDPELSDIDLGDTNLSGFLPLSIKFSPEEYYENHPKVLGLYDGDYQNFSLEGKQHEALTTMVNHLHRYGVQLVVVNQPLTDVYLDQYRQEYEAEFQSYMRELSLELGFVFRDLGTEQWQKSYDLFSDPSHLNRYGAQQVALQLAQDPMLIWPKP